MNQVSNWKRFTELLLSTKRKGIKELVEWLEGTDMKVAPASTRYHSCHPGGLVEHSLNVYDIALKTQKPLIDMFNINSNSLIIACLLHDICKVNYYEEYKKNVKKNGAWVEEIAYTVNDFLPLGHGEKSIILAQQFIKLDEVEMAMIRNHMGAYRDDANQVSQLFSKYPESLIVHQADMIATYVVESNDLLPEFKEKVSSIK